MQSEAHNILGSIANTMENKICMDQCSLVGMGQGNADVVHVTYLLLSPFYCSVGNHLKSDTHSKCIY